MNTEELKRLCITNAITWTDHAIERMIKRSISREEVKEVILNGEEIEDYPDDYPYPSCLILGFPFTGRALHVVCGVGDGVLWIITAYSPDLAEWTDDYKTRKEPL
jgi:hypothetical protein